MRLYTRTGATALTDPATGITYTADDQGGFDFPEEVSEQQRRFHVRGKPAWENDIERQQRLAAEELERRRDPATLQALVEQLTQQAAAGRAAAEQAPEPTTPPAAKRASKRAAKPPAAE